MPAKQASRSSSSAASRPGRTASRWSGTPAASSSSSVRGERELELAVLGEELLPAARGRPACGELAQPLAAVPHQEPAARGVERRRARGTWPGWTRSRIASSPASKTCGRGVRLEPEVAVGGRDAQHGRPPAHVRLLDLARPLEVCSARRASIQAVASASQPGCTQGRRGSVGTASVRPRASASQRGSEAASDVARWDTAFGGEHLFLSRFRHVTGSALRCLPWHKTSTTPWGAASVVDRLTVQQRAGERRFASVVELLEHKGERFVRFAYTTDGSARRGPGDAAGARPGEAARRAGEAPGDRRGARTYRALGLGAGAGDPTPS